jgi:hypothetical protein
METETSILHSLFQRKKDDSLEMEQICTIPIRSLLRTQHSEIKILSIFRFLEKRLLQSSLVHNHEQISSLEMNEFHDWIEKEQSETLLSILKSSYQPSSQKMKSLSMMHLCKLNHERR